MDEIKTEQNQESDYIDAAPRADSSQRSIFFGALAFFAVVVLVAGGYYYVRVIKGPQTDAVTDEIDSMTTLAEIEKNVFSYLVENNPSFATGENALSTREYSTARTAFEAALPSAGTPAEVGQIEYKLAIAESWDGDPVSAVRRLKKLALDEQYSDQQRAYAIMRIGEIYHSFNSETLSNEIFFGDEFFQQQFTQDDGASSIALVRMYEYGADLKPVAVSELRAAWYYLDLIKQLEKKETLTAADTQTIEEYYARIAEAITNADADNEATKDSANAGRLGTNIQVLKATLLGDLAEREKETMENAIDAFEEALVASQINEGGDAKIRYQYARFLMRTGGEERASRIEDILAPFSENRAAYGNMIQFFANHAVENPLGSRPTIIGLGTLSPKFAGLLVDLGFESSLFQ